MGAQAFMHYVQAETPQDGFSKLVEEAYYECGHQSYNGTISTCEMGGMTWALKGDTEENRLKAEEFVEDNDYGEKWVAKYIWLGPKEYPKNSIDPNKGKSLNTFLFYGWASC